MKNKARDANGEVQKKTEWVNVAVWGGLSKYADEWVRKGDLLYVSGKITTRKWEDKNGNTRYKTEIVARELRKLNNFSKNQGQPTENDAPPHVQKKETPANFVGADQNVPDSIDDDLPF